MSRIVRQGAVVLVFVVGSAFGQTWSYDGDVFPEAATPGWTAYGSNAFVTLGAEGGVDFLQIDTSPNGLNQGRYHQIDAGASWAVSAAAGYTVEWRVRLDGAVPTNPSAALVFAGNSINYAYMRVYNHVGDPGATVPLTVELLGSSPGGVAHAIANPTVWHTYRMDVQGTVAKLYVDTYPWPVAVKTDLEPGAADLIYFGDGTGVDNGKYQVDWLRTYQGGVKPAPATPDVLSTANTLFLAHYDGNTGANADFGLGGRSAITAGGVIDAMSKFGAGSLDGNTATGTVSYYTAGNFNKAAGTVEMWIKPANWSDGQYAGFFGVYQAGVGDIRLQKTNGGRLQAYMADPVSGSGWSLTSDALVLDDSWHHIAWTWDTAANVSALYVDGAVVAGTPSLWGGLGTIDYVGTLPATFEVASVQGGSASFLGLIDELRISGIDLYGGQAFAPQGGPWPTPAQPVVDWAYEGDVHPEAATPSWVAYGSNAFASMGTDDGIDYLAVDTSPNGPSQSRYYQINSGEYWNIDTAVGMSITWRVKLDPVVQTNPSAAAIVFGDTDTPYGIFRVYNGTGNPGTPLGFRVVGLQASGTSEATLGLPLSPGWHTYRLDVVPGSPAKMQLYHDDYAWPILTQDFIGPGGVQEIRWGDQTGIDNGKYQVDYIRSHQSGPLPAPSPPDPLATAHTLFLAHYDGDTGQSGLDADFAVGGPMAVEIGGQIDVGARFGAGSLDQYGPAGRLTYSTVGNFETRAGTIEMWIKPANWADGAYAGFIDIVANPANILGGDIRLQKTAANQLQAVMVWEEAGTTYIWSLTSDPLALDDAWHHIAWTWDMDANRSAIYVDGAVVDSTISYTNLAVIDFRGALASEFQIGSVQSGSALFNGLIDEFRISNADLYGGQAFTPPSNAYATPTQQPMGACCRPDGGCEETTFASCVGTWQGVGSTCAEASCSPPPPPCVDPNTSDHTLLLTHYDGNTGNGGLDADLAAGSRTSSGTGGAVVATARFGAGALDPGLGVLSYDSTSNFNVTAGTVEMWVKPAEWLRGEYDGFFSLYEADLADIRLQKTSAGQLQAYMANFETLESWTLTSSVLSLDANWHHIAWTWDFTTGKTALYLDGAVVANVPTLSFLSQIDFTGVVPAVLEIGSVQGGSSDFDGLIDEVRISSVDYYCGRNFAPQTAPWPSLSPCNTPAQDVDGDADVDLADFGSFQACFNGPNRPWSPPPVDPQQCACLDADGDADVDLTDFGTFQACFNGPNRLPACP